MISFAKEIERRFCIAKATQTFSTKYGSISTKYITFQKFNVSLTNDIDSLEQLGPVVQSIISLTSSLRDQLVFYFITKYTDIFVVMQTLLSFFNENIGIY